MAFHFDGTNDYLSVSSSIGTNSFPFSIAVWFRMTVNNSFGTLGIYNRDTADGRGIFCLSVVEQLGPPVPDTPTFYGHLHAGGFSFGSVRTKIAITGDLAFTTSKWYLLVGVSNSISLRSIYLVESRNPAGYVSGTIGGSMPTNLNSGGGGFTEIGRRQTASGYFDGEIGWATTYNGALNLLDVQNLALGTLPLRIRMPWLVECFPLEGQGDAKAKGVIGLNSMTKNGGADVGVLPAPIHSQGLFVGAGYP